MFNRKTLGLAFVGILAAAIPAAMADLIHSSTENYSSLGGTRVLDDLTGTVRTIGAWSPTTVVWEVKEKAVYDERTNTTDVSYTVFNDTFIDPITSFFAPTMEAPSVVTAPIGWIGVFNPLGALGSGVYWSTVSPSLGIPMASSLNTMHLIYSGRMHITLAPGTAIDFITPNIHLLTSQDWVVTSPVAVPAPGAAMLIGLGLSLVSWARRRLA